MVFLQGWASSRADFIAGRKRLRGSRIGTGGRFARTGSIYNKRKTILYRTVPRAKRPDGLPPLHPQAEIERFLFYDTARDSDPMHRHNPRFLVVHRGRSERFTAFHDFPVGPVNICRALLEVIRNIEIYARMPQVPDDEFLPAEATCPERRFIPRSSALGRKAVGGMMNTLQLAPLSSFEKLWRKRGLLRGPWGLRSLIPCGLPRGTHFPPYPLIRNTIAIAFVSHLPVYPISHRIPPASPASRRWKTSRKLTSGLTAATRAGKSDLEFGAATELSRRKDLVYAGAAFSQGHESGRRREKKPIQNSK